MSGVGMVPTMVDTLGWTLLHFLWQGLLLWGLCALLMLILRPAAAAVRYWAGMAILALMGAAPILTFVTLMGTADAATSGPGTSVQVVAGAVGAWSSLAPWVETISPWTVAAWLIGVFLQSSRLALECMRIRRVALRGVAPLAPDWQRIADHLRASLGVRQAVGIMTSAGVAVPMVIGWFRPLILIPPSALLGLTPRQLELIISHELAHVKRLDYAMNGLQILVETLLFYHPGVRAVSTRIREEREHCCDDIVVSLSGDRLGYARALTEVAGLRCSAGMQIAVAATGGRLMGRVRRLVVLPGPQRGAAYWMTGLVVVAALAAGSMRHLPDLGGVLPVDIPAAEHVAVLVAPASAPVPDMVPAAVTDTLPVAAPVAVEVLSAEKAPVAPYPVSAPDDGQARTAISAAASVTAAAPVPTVDSVPVTDPVPASAPVPATAPVPAAVPVPAVAPAAVPAATPAARRPVASAPRAVRPSAEGRVPPPPPPSAPQDAPDGEAPAAPPSPVAEAPPASGRSMAATPAEPEISGGDLLQSVMPEYPRRARLKGIGGFVRLRFVVDERGRVDDIDVLASRQGRYFERVVRKALKRWLFEPFTLDGAPIRRTVERRFDFGMELAAGLRLAAVEPCQKITGTRICRSLRDYEDLPVSVVGTTP
jgi:TonB family protein